MHVSCPLCQAAAARWMRWRDGYSVCHCESCRLLFADPMPTDQQLQEFYQGFLYREPDPNAIRGLVEMKKRELERLFAWNPADLTGKTLLDFGGGTGVTYCAARELGLEVHFYEIDEKAIDFVQRHFDLPPERAYRRLEELDGLTFDYINADNVIEHDKHPVEFVRRLRDLLRPGGMAVIKTPHARNSEMWFYPRVSVGLRSGYASRTRSYNRSLTEGAKTYCLRRWTCDPPRHLYAFSAESLRKAASLAGAEHVEIDYYHLPLWEYSFTSQVLRPKKRLRGKLLQVAALPLLSLEWLSKLIQMGLQQSRLISPGGIILKVRNEG